MSSILLIDDSPTDTHAYSAMLESGNHKVNTAGSAEEGIEVARRLQPDVIVMDVIMPGLNGFEATRELSRDHETAGIPVIILSTKNGEADRIWGLRQGALDYLFKPVSREELLSSIDTVLEKA